MGYFIHFGLRWLESRRGQRDAISISDVCEYVISMPGVPRDDSIWNIAAGDGGMFDTAMRGRDLETVLGVSR